MNRRFVRWIAVTVGGTLVMLAVGIYFGVAGLPHGFRALWYGAMPTAREIQAHARTGQPPLHPGTRVLEIGDTVPAGFGLPDLDGKPRKLVQYRGKRVLLNFWATWCHPCREEMPALARAQRLHPDVQIIGIAMDQPDAIRHWLQHAPVPYPIWLGLASAAIKPAVLFNDRQGLLPYSVLVGADGRIRDTHLGKLDQQRLQAWLGPAPG